MSRFEEFYSSTMSDDDRKKELLTILDGTAPIKLGNSKIRKVVEMAANYGYEISFEDMKSEIMSVDGLAEEVKKFGAIRPDWGFGHCYVCTKINRLNKDSYCERCFKLIHPGKEYTYEGI